MRLEMECKACRFGWDIPNPEGSRTYYCPSCGSAHFVTVAVTCRDEAPWMHNGAAPTKPLAAGRWVEPVEPVRKNTKN